MIPNAPDLRCGPAFGHALPRRFFGRASFATAIFLSLLLSGCFVRRRSIPAAARQPKTPLLSFSQANLLARLHAVADPVQRFLIRATMSPSVEARNHETITDYATINGYILYEKPDSIRVIGMDPLVNSTIFDMASAGREFRLHLPLKKQFVIGDNLAPAVSENKFENLRPSAFLDAMILHPPDEDSEISLAEDAATDTPPRYTLLIAGGDPKKLRLLRSFTFNPYTLEITGQKIFAPSGAVASIVTYSGWKSFAGVLFPSEIEIRRPQESYEVQIRVLEMKMNTDSVTPRKFVLAQPAGTTLRRLP